MDIIKTGWGFFQNEVLGMSWLNRLLGNLLNSFGLDTTGKIGGSVGQSQILCKLHLGCK